MNRSPVVYRMALAVAVLLVIAISGNATVWGDDRLGTPVAAASAGRLVNTQQSLHLKNDCEVDSPLVRLRDVATPVGQSGAAWQRLGGTVIAMLPVDQHEVVIDRQRLIECLQRETQIPLLNWEGASRVHVRYRPAPPAVTATANPVPANSIPAKSASPMSAVLPVSASLPLTAASQTALPEPPSAVLPAPDVVPVRADAASIQRISRLIQYAIDRHDLRLRESYDIEISPYQAGWELLGDLRRVDRIDFDSPPQAGVITAMVSGVTSRQPLQGRLEIEFVVRPMVVVPHTGLRRGQMISRSDLTMVPAPRGLDLQNVITDLEAAVDMEAAQVVQRNQPLTFASITRPTLVQRGEMVEIQVLAGGVTVATNGKAMAAGAAGDLIAVETLEPRKKIMARVARPGIVEIITRPTRVQP